MKRLPFLLALACSILPAVHGENVQPSERIREGEARQQQLRGEAQKLVDQLDSMLDEYQRNALGGEDTKTLQALRDSLARLSVDEMKQVVDLLEKARGAQDAGEAKQRVADAYTSQKAILAQMGKLLAQHQHDQQSAEIAQQLAQLAERQAVNLQNGITLGQWSEGKKPENFEAAAQANLQGQQAEQAAIANELKALAQRVASFAREPENAEQAARFRKGLEDIQKVQPSVENAAGALKEGQLFKAVTDEKNARDAMRRLAKDIAPPPERSETLRKAQKELAKAIEDQKEIVKDTEKAAGGEQDFDKWLEQQKKANPRLAKTPLEKLKSDARLQKQFEAQKKGRPDMVAAQEQKQGEIAGRNDEMAQSLAKTAPEAARDLKAAQEKMQDARSAMSDHNAPAAAKNAQDALAAMQMADAKLQQELGKEEALAGKSGDPVKDLQALQQQAQALAQQQAEAAKNPDKSMQAAMAQKVNELAKQAAAMAPKAAPAAQQAAAQAQQAAQAAQANQPAQAAQAQQAAAQNLAQAAQQIAQQAAAAQQAQQQQAAAQQAEKQLAEIIIAEQKLQVDTAKSAVVVQKRKVAKASDFKGQPEKQGEIGQQTATFVGNLPPDAPAAKSALEAAQLAMTDAQTALGKPEVQPAQFNEALALEKLYAAQTAVNAAVEQAQQAMPQQPNAQPNAAQVAAQLAQAQQQVAQANQALQQAQQPGQPAAAQQQAAQKAAAQLAQAAAQAGQAAAQTMPGNATVQQAAQAGAQAAAKGAVQAAGQNLPAAQAQAQAAQQALAQAQAALAQAQAGLMAANGNGNLPAPTGNMPGQPGQPGSPSGQPGQPGQPGQAGQPGQPQAGNMPGNAPGQQNGQPGTEGAQQYSPPTGNEAVKVETRGVAGRASSFAALPPRERAVIEQSQAEKYPEEYGAQVEQYLLNLARESSEKK
ncbi:hypothetical protein CfE428DRAFT_2690 [Chthoniobacter flavus Ellin428]|uniref:Uncharacterized protein n=1 Tax=Chthoniobacter flavus Ellin428 TaxID=497964 RepID=B4D189_9BACT|nr:hypothetical protein [Chthoniobacter flavus]EDY20101.1 hypothetical protein CfE428DRAFT_2690 [Chthoniobacter flavus Ellin428]TCO93996.1 hypothetical protein EV701_10382 [Chthoniobacter flavus]